MKVERLNKCAALFPRYCFAALKLSYTWASSQYVALHVLHIEEFICWHSHSLFPKFYTETNTKLTLQKSSVGSLEPVDDPNQWECASLCKGSVFVYFVTIDHRICYTNSNNDNFFLKRMQFQCLLTFTTISWFHDK